MISVRINHLDQCDYISHSVKSMDHPGYITSTYCAREESSWLQCYLSAGLFDYGFALRALIQSPIFKPLFASLALCGSRARLQIMSQGGHDAYAELDADSSASENEDSGFFTSAALTENLQEALQSELHPLGVLPSPRLLEQVI